jgi:hypothetical protein
MIRSYWILSNLRVVYRAKSYQDSFKIEQITVQARSYALMYDKHLIL